ncbi:hypothetical protein UMM65_08965 [Aureibaculum sp. 2210JD6-5]|uniref:hypothetical protein n=1 Tax=Aureibaculum sp. 2210JD6-5 TaxID=3103957 RepID=UPI002AAE227F|nr:hypothetical protein [Aureibaculum sp. 2210JD6-5]MDY7395370.1 hypothetical protein [Aureibaculum sp. 2210JD6-5]
MKLYFSKDDQDEIVVKMSTSTVQEDFSYVEMIKNLLENNEFDDTDFTDDFTDDEKTRIETMLNSINASIVSENDVEENNQTSEDALD